MSQTVTRRIQTAASPENIAQAFALMGLGVEWDAQLRLFHGTQGVAIKIPSEVLERIGFPPTVFSDGVGLNFQDGQVTLVYDHYNKATVDGLAEYIEALNAIGSQAEQLRAFLAQGYTFEPILDLKKQEIGIRAVAPNHENQADVWGTNNEGGGLW
jgi:hypothetical protein